MLCVVLHIQVTDRGDNVTDRFFRLKLFVPMQMIVLKSIRCLNAVNNGSYICGITVYARHSHMVSSSHRHILGQLPSTAIPLQIASEGLGNLQVMVQHEFVC